MMSNQPAHPRGSDTAAVVVAGVVLLVALGAWAAGSVVTWIWTGHWPAVPPSAALSVLVRTAASPSRPGRAWPPGTRLAPRWILAVAEGVGAVAGVAAVAVPGAVWSKRRSRPTATRRVGGLRQAVLGAPRGPVGNRWATRRDLGVLRVAGPTSGRLILGRSGGRARSHRSRAGLRRRWRSSLVAAEPRASVVVLGPSQSGKTTGLAIPAILEWQGPVVATSVKADLAHDTIVARSVDGPAWVYDPTRSTGLPSATWSPLAACGTWQGARRTTAWLCQAARTAGATGSGDEDFWYSTAAKLLAPHLLAAALGGRDVGQVVRWVDAQEEDEVAHLLEDAGELDALGAAAASWQRDDRTRSSVYTTAETVLDAYADPSVLASAVTSEIDPVRLLAGGAPTLYVCAPGHEQDRLRPVFATLLQTIITAAYDASLRRGGPLDPPLLIVLDEAANIAPLRDLDALASTAASHGIQLVTVWQDLAQLRVRYGERASTVVNNHRAKIVLSGISDPASLDYASRLIGDADVGDHSVTVDPTGARSTTRAHRERRLAPDAELRRIRPGEGVLVYGHLPPARIRLRPWFTEPGLCDMAARQPPTIATATADGVRHDDQQPSGPAGEHAAVAARPRRPP